MILTTISEKTLIEKVLEGERVFTGLKVNPSGLQKDRIFKKLYCQFLECLRLSQEPLDISDSFFEEANLPSIFLRNCRALRTRFLRSNLEGADFSGAALDYANFSKANLSEANFSSASIYRTDFVNSELFDTKFGQIENALNLDSVMDAIILNGRGKPEFVKIKKIEHFNLRFVESRPKELSYVATVSSPSVDNAFSSFRHKHRELAGRSEAYRIVDPLSLKHNPFNTQQSGYFIVNFYAR